MPYHLENLILKDATIADSAAIRQLALEANIDAWSVADYADEISRPDSFVLTISQGEVLLGFLLARLVPGTTDKYPDADLYNIAVDPAGKRRGIGTKLLISLLERLAKRDVRNVWLEVRESNQEAITFYESHGFVAELTRPNFYVNPTENAVIMRLRIGPEQDVSEA
jgi:ribosomal-protein-alanine N-acetyltransferase